MSLLCKAKLSDIVELNPRYRGDLDNDSTVSFLPMASISADVTNTTEAEQRKYYEVSKGYTPFLSGDLLIAKITPCFQNGKITQVILPYYYGFGSTEFHIIRPHSAILDTRYLLHFLRQEHIILDGQRKMTGSAGQRRVPEHYFAELQIPLPPFPEQRRIAEILDLADAIRVKRREALALLDTLAQSVFLEMFGDHKTILLKWQTRKLGDMLDFLTSGSRGWAAYYSDSGDLFLRIQNIRHDELLLDDVAYVRTPDTAEAKRTQVKPGDVLLTITADLGRTCVIPVGIGTAFINQHLSILRTNAIMPRFLSAFLASPVGQHQILGRNKHGVKAGLNFDDIRSFVIPVPPSSLQESYTNRITAIEKQKSAYHTSLAEMDSLFASLQHRAFRGEL